MGKPTRMHPDEKKKIILRYIADHPGCGYMELYKATQGTDPGHPQALDFFEALGIIRNDRTRQGLNQLHSYSLTPIGKAIIHYIESGEFIDVIVGGKSEEDCEEEQQHPIDANLQKIRGFIFRVKQAGLLNRNEADKPLMKIEYIMDNWEDVEMMLLINAISTVRQGLDRIQRMNIEGVENEVAPYLELLDDVEQQIRDYKMTSG